MEALPPARRAASARAQGGAYAGLNGIRAAAKPKSSRGSSRFRGVSWCEKGKKWRALLWDGNRQVTIYFGWCSKAKRPAKPARPVQVAVASLAKHHPLLPN